MAINKKLSPSILLLVVLYFSCSSENKPINDNSQLTVQETDSTIYIRGDVFEGVVFKPSFRWNNLFGGNDSITYPILVALPENNEVKPWTPPISAILSFEGTFQDYWSQASTDSLAEVNNKVWMPYKRLDAFQRQYVGFIDSTGSRSIWVNIINVKHMIPEWTEEPIIMDGSALDRSLYYNVDKDSIYQIFPSK